MPLHAVNLPSPARIETGLVPCNSRRYPMKLPQLFPLAAAALLVGCASVEEPPVRDVGPFPTRWQAEIDAHLAISLIDPDSRRVRYDMAPVAARGPEKASVGYGVCAWVNARNRFGGYTGAKETYFFFQQGRLVSSGLGAPAAMNEYYCSAFRKAALQR